MCKIGTWLVAREVDQGKGKIGEQTCIRIHVHVREKVMTINAGAGTQCVYWLGATAVHRYLSQPHAYTTNFSHEMTAKAILAEDGAQLVSEARVADTIQHCSTSSRAAGALTRLQAIRRAQFAPLGTYPHTRTLLAYSNSLPSFFPAIAPI